MKVSPLLVRVLTAVWLIYCCGSAGALAQNKSAQPISANNFSTPEKTVHYFYEAFRKGNPDILVQVLIEGGSYAEFSPQYKIDTPNPIIAGADIVKKTVVKKWGGAGEPIEIDDILIYAFTKKDPNLIVRRPGVAMPDEKFCFLVRKVCGQWKLVKVYSGWPTFIHP